MGEFAVVGGAEQLVRHAALQHGPVAHYPAREHQHLQTARNRFHRLPIQRTKDVEGGAAPGDEMLTLVARPSDEIGNDCQRQRGGEVGDRVDGTSAYRGFDDGIGLFVDRFPTERSARGSSRCASNLRR